MLQDRNTLSYYSIPLRRWLCVSNFWLPSYFAFHFVSYQMLPLLLLFSRPYLSSLPALPLSIIPPAPSRLSLCSSASYTVAPLILARALMHISLSCQKLNRGFLFLPVIFSAFPLPVSGVPINSRGVFSAVLFDLAIELSS